MKKALFALLILAAPLYGQDRAQEMSDVSHEINGGIISTQLPNLFHAGPCSGGAQIPTYRLMCAADLVAAGMSGGATNALLDGLNHTDTLAGTVVRGDIIVGNITPKWSRLALGTAGKFLASDGSDIAYKTVNDSTTDSTPDTTADFGFTWDTSASGHKKVLLEKLGPTQEAFVTIGTTAKLASERALTAGTGVTITDAGAGSTVTIAADTSGLTAEPVMNGLRDSMQFYDNSAATLRNMQPGMLGPQRGYTRIADELFFNATTTVYTGNLIQTVNGAGTATSAIASTSSHPGILECTTGSTNAGRCSLWGGATTTGWLFSGGATRLGTIVRLPTLSDASETYTVRLGFTVGSTATDPTDGVWFSYTDADGGADGHWFANTRIASGTVSSTDTGVVATTNWTTFEFEVNAAGTSATFYIAGTSVATIAATISTTAVHIPQPCNIVKSVGTTARVIDCDAYWIAQDYTTAR